MLSRPAQDFAKQAVGASMTFESSFATVRQVTSATEEEFERFSAAAHEMSERVGMSAAGIADVMAEAGRLGVANDILVDFTESAIGLGNAFNMNATDAATSMARIFNISGLEQTTDNVNAFGSSVTYLANNYATTAEEILEMAKGISGTAHLVGIGTEDVLGLATALTSLGISAGRGAMSFSQALQKMETSVATGDKYLDDFAKVSGMTVEEFSRVWKEDATSAFTAFLLGLSQMDEEGMSAIAVLQDTGIKTMRLTDTLLRTAGATGILNNALLDANGAWRQGSELSAVTEKRYSTTAVKVRNLGNRFTNLKEVIGNDVKPAFETLLEAGGKAIDWFNGLDTGTRNVIESIGAVVAAFGPLLVGVGMLSKGIGAGLKTISGAVTGLKAMVAAGSAATLGYAALVAAVVAGVAVLADFVSGAHAAREATKALSATVDDISKAGFEGIYKGIGGNELANFGLSASDFTKAKEETADWLGEIVSVWGTGKKETKAEVQDYVDQFKEGSDGVREQIESQKSLLEGFGVLDDDTVARMEADVKTLDSIDAEVSKLLQKRRNRTLSDDELERLTEILKIRQEISARWGADNGTEGYDSIQQQLDADLAKARALHEAMDPKNFGSALVAISQGYQAVQDGLDASYDAQYAEIMKIEDATARDAALSALNAQYAQQRADAAEQYRNAMLETAGVAGENLNLGNSITKLNELSGLLEAIRGNAGDQRGEDIAGINAWLEQVGATGIGHLQTLYSLILQLKSAGSEDADVASALGITEEELTTILSTFESIKDTVNTTDDLPGLSALLEGMDENAANVISLSLNVEKDEAQTIIDEFIASYDDTSVKVAVAMDNINSTAIAAWEAANSNVVLKGPMASVGVQLGSDAASTIAQALENDALAVYGPDGLPIKVTPDVLEKITAESVCAYDEDGTLHVMITPEIGTTDYVDFANDKADEDQTGLFGLDIGSTSDQINKVIADVQAYSEAMDQYADAKQRAKDATDMTEQAGAEAEAQGWLTSASTAMNKLSTDIGALTDADLDNIADQIMAIYAALQNEDLTEEERTSLTDQVKDLIGVVEAVETNESGEYLAEGIAEGMVKHGWAGSASELATNLTDAINSAFGIASPATKMMPSGNYISAGIGEGMKNYSFSGEASEVASSAKTSLDAAVTGTSFSSVGGNMIKGIVSGITNNKSSLINAMKDAVRDAVNAAKEEADIHSPSRVMRDEVGKMLIRGVGEGVTDESKYASKMMANATKYMVDSARDTLPAGTTNNTRTYNNDNSIVINLDGVSMRDEQDIRSLAIELAAFTQRGNQQKGVLA